MEKLSKLYVGWINYNQDVTGYVEFKEWILGALKIHGRHSEKRALDIWNQCVCMKLSNTLDDMNLQSLRDSSLLNAYLGKRTADELKYYLLSRISKYIDACEKISPFIPEWAKHHPNGFQRWLGSCFGTSCSYKD